MPADHLFPTTLAGSLPKPGWLAEPEKLWASWRASGAELTQAKRDAALVWLKIQEDAGIDILSDGEQFRIHFVHGFLEQIEGIDWNRKTKMGIRNNRYEAEVPTVTGPVVRKAPDPRRRCAFHQSAYQTRTEVHAAGADDDLRHDRRHALRAARRHGHGVREAAERGGPRNRGARRRRHPIRRAGLQCVHGGCEGLGHHGARGARRTASNARQRSISATATASRPT